MCCTACYEIMNMSKTPVLGFMLHRNSNQKPSANMKGLCTQYGTPINLQTNKRSVQASLIWVFYAEKDSRPETCWTKIAIKQLDSGTK